MHYLIMGARPQDEYGDELARIVWRAAKHGCRNFSMFCRESSTSYERVFELRAENYPEPLAIARVSVFELRAANYPEPLAIARVSAFERQPVFQWECSTVLCWL